MKKRVSGSLIAIILAVIGTLVLITCRSVAVEGAYPGLRIKAAFSRHIVARVRGALSASATKVENLRLKREVESLVMVHSELVRLEEENARLRSALKYANEKGKDWVAAEVIARDGGAASVHRTLRVDKGSLSGVKVNDVVAVPDGLVGRVSAVTPHTAEVILISDESQRVACEVETYQTPIPMRGIVVGGGEDILIMRYLVNVAKFAPRTRVVTSGLGGIYPRGIVVGALLSAHNDAEGIAKEYEVLPAVNFTTLKDVFIRREK